MCGGCGTVQKSIDAGWRREIAEIYGDYSIYFQAGGTEQAVFDVDSGEALLRSERLVRHLLREVAFAHSGRLLDVGCGNGAFLSAFARAATGWSLSGTEWSDKYRAVVEAIPGVETLYTAPLDQVPGPFDVVSVIHALEHIPDPVGTLEAVARKLSPDGVLLIEVPNLARNPFDLLVADHASHFTPEVLAAVVERAGFRIVLLSNDWVPKEISVLASVDAGAASAGRRVEGAAEASLRWLFDVREAARATRRISRDAPFGLFGSSIAATWLGAELQGEVDFFVDEDAHRHASPFLGRSIIPPSRVPAGAHVFVPLGGDLAPRVAARLSAAFPAVRWHTAPALPL
jgi:2-polyprenyl-3-methyl-5-hydroxy-6-metoxy-1,4-benzoquinol methylase